MSKESVLQSLQVLTVEQSNIQLSLKTEGEGGNRLTVIKTVDGEGYNSELSNIINGYYALSVDDREWVVSSFYVFNQQSVGGRPDCPIC